MNHIKRLWAHYLVLMFFFTILSFSIHWVYRFFQYSLGREPALFSLTITIMIVVVFGIQGAIHTHRIVRMLQREIDASNKLLMPERTEIPFVLKVFKIDCCPLQRPLSETKNCSEEPDTVPLPFFSCPRKRRGKQSRFEEEKIRKAVLKWENRDPSFPSRTLEEFLAQEFGRSPDGVLLMAASTFYDARRRILKELEAHEHKP